ncbi:pentatricopeptide repeat-containing protein At5g57250, mitochondrial-like [Salvia splendens]|uniref:pentatricopeptide repeat-containing protein At5g57250, mitochondrial-like n=1 Tax=Salvia splendens TaxID=180675 RepID=UPI001C268EF1|nr:pentatricopeptide repeat-containing protein At5g57250, mitochondrial-like [Salvia splendens]XP_042039354.1 pentatricopeptide repeat-containing protein At5g57250, mitochondrial-like [Salvia splendens]XP_042039355.1 pentatricopeptide repeat-containing protein At5g57250, mitochondrial-like [Salvia splendens]XP_042039356.1 pentatricopeptide repeat-containing protein At5g57250, mitochondrial-like [Salvia splendens]XP_042039357.1 pentatricopeptide repeat-containing protein At5g57250, mitochondrial
MLPLSTLIKSGVTPTLKDFSNFFLFLSRNRRFQSIIHLFSQLSCNNIEADVRTHTIYTEALLEQHKYEEAADILKTLTGKSSILHKNQIFNTLIQGICSYNRDPERGLSILKDFLKMDAVVPSSRTFCLLICCFSRMGKMDRVIDLLEVMSGDKFKFPFDNYVCSSVILGFVRIGESEHAVGFYETALKSGSLTPNAVTCTTVLSAYCKLRDVNNVSHLVTWMESNKLPLDVVFYSTWMHGCLMEGMIYEALQRYREMVDTKVELDTIAYTILIDGFSKNGYVEKAVGFLRKMRKDGLTPNLVTYTAIILGFCKKGKLDEAFTVFSMLGRLGIEADEFMYAILIDGVCKKGDFDLVYSLLDEMEKKGISPGVVTYNTVINGLCKVGRTTEADDFSKGIVGDVITYSTLLKGYVEEQNFSGILETKRRLEAEGIQMDVVMCNILIKALLMVGLFEDALAVYKGLPQMNLSPNSVSYCTLIDGYCKVGRINEALEIFDDFRRASSPSAASYKLIILGLCNEGMVDMATDVFLEYMWKGMTLDRTVHMTLIEATLNRKGADSVSEIICRMKDIGPRELQIVCNDAVSLLCEMGCPEASYSASVAMRSKELALESMGYYSIIRALMFECKTLWARLILTCFIKMYGLSDLYVCKTIVNYLCLNNGKKALVFLSRMNEKKWSVTIPISTFMTLTKDGRVVDAYELMMGAESNLPCMDLINYSVMIDALCKAKHINKALDLCTLAKKKGLALNIVIYNSVINGLCSQGCLIEAFRLFNSLEKIDILPTEVTYGTLIDALVKEGLLQDARILFERMILKEIRPNTRIYNSLINGYCKASLLEEAIEIFQDLEARNLKPDGFTIGALTNGYCQKGDMEGALKFFFEFKASGLLPDFLGFIYLLRGLCAKGRMEESRSILREMLQTQSIIDLLQRVDTGVESDSVDNLLVSLCEQGRIHDALSLLEEVGSLFFSAKSISSWHVLDQHELKANPEVAHSSYAGSDFLSLSSDYTKVDDMLSSIEPGKMQPLKDFNSFYSLIHSLCLNGELAKANKLTKLLMKS